MDFQSSVVDSSSVAKKYEMAFLRKCEYFIFKALLLLLLKCQQGFNSLKNTIKSPYQVKIVLINNELSIISNLSELDKLCQNIVVFSKPEFIFRP